MCSICPSIQGWNNINSFVSISNILFNSFIISAANCGPLSNTILFGNLSNFHTLSLNNLANSSTNVSSIIITKCIILDNLLQTTIIASFLTTNSNFVIKSTIKYVYSFFRTSLNFNFLANYHKMNYLLICDI